mmetsp:Transcript_133958/g.303838  ORF Transcript_133958/g.303838 Transcript_133958/m.303838 type:complete len:98 (+) Transcript_133958:3-296(+)
MATPFLEEAGVDVESAVASLCKLVCPSAGPQEDNFVSNAMSVASSVAVSESGSVKKGKKIPKGTDGNTVPGGSGGRRGVSCCFFVQAGMSIGWSSRR